MQGAALLGANPQLLPAPALLESPSPNTQGDSGLISLQQLPSEGLWSMHKIPEWFGLDRSSKHILFHSLSWAGTPSTAPSPGLRHFRDEALTASGQPVPVSPPSQEEFPPNTSSLFPLSA